MHPHAIYPIFNFGILAPWALLVFAPRWRWTARLVHGAFVVVFLAAAYAALLFATMSSVPADAGGATLRGVMKMFENPWIALLCWIHYLAFDLFVGAWIARDGARLELPHLVVAPCLVLTLFFGPAGLLVYLAVRLAMRRTVSFWEAVRLPSEATCGTSDPRPLR